MSAPSSKALSPNMTRDSITFPARAFRLASYAAHPKGTPSEQCLPRHMTLFICMYVKKQRDCNVLDDV
jgi:hypothetical protein